MKPLDKEAEIRRYQRNLPHWEQAGCTYFITWRLADSLPESKIRGWLADRDRWLAWHPEPWTREVSAEYHREFTDRIERWQDAGHGSCILRRADVREIVAKALHFFDGRRYTLEACVIMPNHVHVLVTPQSDTAVPAVTANPIVVPAANPNPITVPVAGAEPTTGGTPVSHSPPSLSSILHSWKSYTAHEIRKLIGGTGPLWMDENFDHAVRSAEQLAHFHRYLRENPVKAGLPKDDYYLWQSDTAVPAVYPASPDLPAGDGNQITGGTPVSP